MAILRFLFYGALVYLYYLIAYPGWYDGHYALTCLSVIFCGAAGLFILFKLIDWSSALAKLSLEAIFIAAVALYIGYTLPQKSGRPPIEQWMNGHHPTQTDASEGLQRLGISPKSKPGQLLLGMFVSR
ncbi:MAG: hypothetical protein ACYCPQ_03870 [Elusimicrobiota bacterium]